VLHSDGKDDADVTARVKEATGAFASLKHCLFKRKDVTNEAKVAVYNSLVLSILLYGCESWSLTERLRNQLRTFHRRCVRDMCRLNMWHVQQYRITAQDLELGEAVGYPLLRDLPGATTASVAWACATPHRGKKVLPCHGLLDLAQAARN
jgi:hypothetical protein